MTDTTEKTLLNIYRRLLARYGEQHWWPADSPFEVVVGAILTQSAAWTNVEKAISNLKVSGALSPQALLAMPVERLAGIIRPSGYYNAKARKLKAFVEWLQLRHGGDLDKFLALDVASLRRELLAIHGVGEETADSIILYAAAKPVFVIDAYTRRILQRLGISPASQRYSAWQALFTDNLPRQKRVYNEYHALLVRHGKNTCQNVPCCDRCCLEEICLYSLPQGRE